MYLVSRFSALLPSSHQMLFFFFFFLLALKMQIKKMSESLFPIFGKSTLFTMGQLWHYWLRKCLTWRIKRKVKFICLHLFLSPPSPFQKKMNDNLVIVHFSTSFVQVKIWRIVVCINVCFIFFSFSYLPHPFVDFESNPRRMAKFKDNW